MQQTLKNHFALNISAYNKFYLNRGFKGLLWLWSHSSRVVLILYEYFNINCIIISLRDSFWATREKLSPFDKLCLNRGFEGFFWSRSDSSKVVLIPNVYFNSFAAPRSVKTRFATKQSHYNWFCRNWTIKRLFWLQSDSSKVVVIQNVYLNI